MVAAPLLTAALAAPNCSLPKAQFFGRVDVYIDAAGPGSRDIWNVTHFWSQDSTGALAQAPSMRLDTMAHDRALSSGSVYVHSNYVSVQAGSTRYDVDADGKCTTNTSAAPLLATACTGTIAQWMPMPIAYDMPAKQDAYLGTDTVDGVPVDVWGWDGHCGDPTQPMVESQHRVYVSVATQCS